MVMYYHEPVFLAGKLACCHQGHSAGLYNQDMTISILSSKNSDLFATKLGLLVHNHKPECPVKKLD